MDNVEAHTMRLLGTVPAGTMRSNATHFFPTDILYGRLRPYLNKVLAPTFEGLASAEFIPLTPEAGIEPNFVRYRINAADFVSFASRLDEGDRPRVDWNGIRGFDVSLPPSGEQQRIVEAIDSYLTRLDAAVASLERTQGKLKAYRASVLKAAIEGRLVPTEAALAHAEEREYEPAELLLGRILKERRRRWEEVELAKLKAHGKTPKDDKWKARYEEPVVPATSMLPKLPKGWCWASVDQLCTEVTDGDHQPPPVSDSGIPFLVIGDVRSGTLDFSDCRRVPKSYYDDLDWKRRPDSGDLLYTVVGSYGIPVRVPDNQAFCVQRHIAILKAPPADIKTYLLYSLASGFVFRQASDMATGTAQKTVGLGSLRRIAIPLPPQEESLRIGSEIERLISSAQRTMATLEDDMRRVSRLRHSILKWAFEGKLVDQDPNDEPTEKLLARIRVERAALDPIKKKRNHNAQRAA
jgi:type I restriction enzyme S subunit